MKKDSSAVRIVDALMGGSRPHPLSKVQCKACGVFVQQRSFVPSFGTCDECYWDYDMHMKERSQLEWEMATS